MAMGVGRYRRCATPPGTGGPVHQAQSNGLRRPTRRPPGPVRGTAPRVLYLAFELLRYKFLAEAQVVVKRSPTFFDHPKRSDTFNTPANFNLPIEANPAAAIQPHSQHSGRPPIWQGTTTVDRSAEMQFVIWANMHAEGESGG